MARNKQASRRTVQATADGYENFVARVGMQTPNQHSASTYRANFTSRNRMLVEWSYRSSWLIGEAVDAIPDDMTRKGIRITSEIDAKDRGTLEAQLDQLQIWDALNDVLKWSRLYGGAVGFIMIEGQAPMAPLRLETIGEGKFKGILPLDRWMINPVLTRRIKEMGPNLGKPELYDVVTTATGIPAWRIHHSRLIRFDGVTLPFQQKMTENEWGMSVVERIWDRLTAFDSATVGAAQLVYKAHLRTYKVEKLRELIALGGPAFEALLKNIDLIRQFQSNEGMTLMDAKDTFETHQYSFAVWMTFFRSSPSRLAVLLAFHWCACSGSPLKVSQRVTQTLPTIMTGLVHCRNVAYACQCAGCWTLCIVRSSVSRCRTISRLSLTRYGRCQMWTAQRWL